MSNIAFISSQSQSRCQHESQKAKQVCHSDLLIRTRRHILIIINTYCIITMVIERNRDGTSRQYKGELSKIVWLWSRHTETTTQQKPKRNEKEGGGVQSCGVCAV